MSEKYTFKGLTSLINIYKSCVLYNNKRHLHKLNMMELFNKNYLLANHFFIDTKKKTLTETGGTQLHLTLWVITP